MSKSCTRKHKDATCCCYCCYNKDCSVSCFLVNDLNCDNCGTLPTQRNSNFQSQLNLIEGGGNI